MKKNLLFSLAICGLSSGAFAQKLGLDNFFGNKKGIADISVSALTRDAANAVAVQSDNKTLVFGRDINTDKAILMRLTPQGVLDATFGSGGYVSVAFGTIKNYGFDVAVAADGKIVVTGYGTTNNKTNIGVMRFNTNGQIDATFGDAGKTTLAIRDLDFGKSLAILPDGKILVAGDSGGSIVVAKLLTNGKLDETWGNSGFSGFEFSSETAFVNKILIDAQGRIVVVGEVDLDGAPNGATDMFWYRMKANGSEDLPLKRVGEKGIYEVCWDAAIEANGKFILVGNKNTPGAPGGSDVLESIIYRLNADGVKEGTFTRDFGPLLSEQLRSVVIEKTGRIVVGGNVSFEALIFRLESNLTLSSPTSQFVTNYQVNVGSSQDQFNDALINKNGQIVLGGYSTVSGGNTNFLVARYNTENSTGIFEADANNIALRVSPNPTNETVTVQYALDEASDVNIELYDLQGKLVKTLLNAQRQAENQYEVFDIQDLVSGTYICRIQTAKGNANVKIIKM